MICEECYWYELERMYCFFHACHVHPDEETCGRFEQKEDE